MEKQVEEVKGYDSIELSDSEFKAIVNDTAPVIEPGKKAEEQPVKDAESKPDEKPAVEEEVKMITIDGKEYPESDLIEAMKDSQNKSVWQANNTKTSQEIAEQRKAVEPLVKIIEKLKGKEQADLVDSIKAAFLEDDTLGQEAVDALEAALAFDSTKYKHPAEKELAEEKAKRERLEADKEAEKVLSEESAKLKKDYKLTDSKVQAVIDFAVNKFEETKQAISLEDAYKLMEFENLKNQAKQTPKVPNVVNKNAGAKDIKSASTPGKYKSYDDIDISDVNLFSST